VIFCAGRYWAAVGNFVFGFAPGFALRSAFFLDLRLVELIHLLAVLGRLGEVLLGHLQVVLGRNQSDVSDLCWDHMEETRWASSVSRLDRIFWNNRGQEATASVHCFSVALVVIFVLDNVS
jgi:hypothetical protein